MKQIEINNPLYGYTYITQFPYDDTHSFYGVFTTKGLRDIFFVSESGNNYILCCDRSYVYGSVDHFNILEAYQVDKPEGNNIYTSIAKSKFISKSGKTFYKTNKL